MTEFDAVLREAGDVLHAAKAVVIAEGLHAHGEELDATLRQAKQDTTHYAATTTALLARITNALAD
jgi:cobalamin biosynthesis Mg chelatase CobN